MKIRCQAVQAYEQEVSELFIGFYGFFLHPEEKMPISCDILARWVTEENGMFLS